MINISKKIIKLAIYFGLTVLFIIFLLDFNIQFFKRSIEEKLSSSTGLEVRVQNLSLGYDFNSLSISAMGINFFDQKNTPKVELTNILLESNYLDFLNEDIKLNYLSVDTLKLNLMEDAKFKKNQFGLNPRKIIKSLGGFKEVNIGQTIISSKKDYEIGEINFLSESDGINFSIDEHPLNLIFENSNNIFFDISGSITTRGLADYKTIADLTISTNDFKIDGNLQLIDATLNFLGKINQVDAKKSLKYFPQSPSKSKLIENFGNAIKSGSINDIEIEFETNLQTREILKNKFESKISFTELNFLDAKIKLKEYDGQLLIDKGNLAIEGIGSVLNKFYKIDAEVPYRPKDNRIISVNFSDQKSNLVGSANYLENQDWDLSFSDGDKFSGDFTIPKTVKDIPEVIIENLVLPGDKSNKVSLEPSDIPKVTLISRRIKVGDQELPEFEIQLIPNEDILLVSYLKLERLKVDNNPILFSGAWLAKDKTIINTKLIGDNLEQLLSAMGVEKKIKGGKYDLDIRLYCDCAPWQVKLDSISGEIKGDIQEGIFTDEDPSIGRVFSLLNIDSISRRLRLNVDDIVSKGFAYDTIKGRAVINDSKIKIDYFNVDSTSNHISVKGHSNLDIRTYNFQANVRPEIADSVPLATYLAGGGLAGLGVWLADKTIFKGDLLNDIVDKIIDIKYDITGPWSDPVISEKKKIL